MRIPETSPTLIRMIYKMQNWLTFHRGHDTNNASDMSFQPLRNFKFSNGADLITIEQPVELEVPF